MKSQFVTTLKFTLLIFTLIFFSQCKRKIKGCTDSAAINFKSDATKDDGSCQYLKGPKDPGFENGGSWSFTSNSNGGTYQGKSYAAIETGTGFLPSEGIKYAKLNGYNSFDPSPEASLFQDDVDLTKASTLSFDYTFSGTVGAGGGIALVEILFTSNGTKTLWTRTLSESNSAAIQKTGQVIILPASSAPGRLTIRFSAIGGNQVSIITKTDATFGIDNIVVN